MTDVLVSHLRLRVPPDRRVRAQARVEDALRLADPDDRLLVCRRLDLGRMPHQATPVHWAIRSARRVAELRARSVHATWPGSAERDAVWFHSAEEARSLLLRELAAGRTPLAWFWRLAVRDWDGAPLAAWLPRLLRQAQRDPVVAVSVARAVVAVAERGQLATIATALAGEPDAWDPPSDGVTEHARLGTPRPAPAQRARRLLERLHPAAMTAVVRILSDPAEPVRVRAILARLALIAAEPALATQSPELDILVTALVAAAERHDGNGTHPPAVEPPNPPAPNAPQPPTAPPDTNGDTAIGRQPDRSPAPQGAGPTTSPDITVGLSTRLPDAQVRTIVSASPTQEQRSQGAGLFLLVRPLILLGLPEWLSTRPNHVDARFAQVLLHVMATRMRIPPDDPVFAAIGLTLDQQLAATIHPIAQDITAWRVGLDRWLRRVAHIRLSDVVTRRGWVLLAGEHLRVRYRVDDADIRLRRRALDLDPGWVPWLGQVIHYHYSDHPLP